MDTVDSIMTVDPITFKIPSTVTDLVVNLIKYKITGLPVVDGNGRYAGIVTRRDVFAKPEETQAALIVRKQTPVNVDTPVIDAARLMAKERRRHLAVTDSEGKVVGILTPQDFLKIVEREYGSILVKNVMKNISFPIWEMTPLPVVYRSMRMTGIFTYPITDSQGNFKGLVTDRDLFDKVQVGTIRSDSSQTLDEDDPWSWDGVRNVVSYFIEKNHLKIPEEPVKTITIYNPVIANANERLSLAARRMRDGNFNQLPVTSNRNGLEGILLDLDVMSVFGDNIQ
ncbi:MAG: CBS domain-containing protein [Candidatus Thermoplasmatota archaeon]|jgi:CBS domain-containing protein|nr:CBS domain-containing protein [Candidatus Thermoplasmatota archaeon]